MPTNKKSSTASSRPGQIRLIGGQWKRTPIAVPDVPGLRPTPDRVRETLFNWLGQKVQGANVADLFAGTGALGFEAASRGAASAQLFEVARSALTALEALKAKLNAEQIELISRDALAVLRAPASAHPPWDIVFLDPPFGQGWIEKILPLLPAHLGADALVYVECELALGDSADFRVLKADKAGVVYYHLLSFKDSA